MLRIYQSKSAGQAKSYFSEELTQGDYYGATQEMAGMWGGKTAERLGLKGEVTKDAFNQLVDNINPENGERLTERSRADRTAGYDMTFNAPKSFSIIYEFTQDQRLLEVFREAVHDTMQDIEESMYTRVRKDGLDEDRQTGNLVYAEFVHFTARPTPHAAPDCHTHAHCYVPNVTYDEAEGQWKAGQFRHLKSDAPLHEAMFHSRLSGKLADMGYDIERDGKFWTIAGLEKDTLAKFSKRTQEIEKLADQLNITSDAAKDGLAATSRAGKIKDQSLEALREGWWSALDDTEITALNALAKVQPEDGEGRSDLDKNVMADAYVDYALRHQLERQSTVRLSRVKETALRAGFGQVSGEEIDAAFSRRDDVIRKEINTQGIPREWVTTREVLQEEKSIIAFTQEGNSYCRKLNYDYDIGEVTDHHSGKSFALSEEQQQVVSGLLDSRHRVMAVEGKAGTGKTTTLSTLIDGIEQGGGHAHCFAPTANAAYVTLKQDGEAYHCEAMQQAHTLARLLVDTKLQEQTQDGVLLVDEAGLMSVKEMHTLFEIAHKHNNRVILVGDTGQHNSVIRGDAYRILQEEAGLQPLALDNIRRQSGIYREAVKAIAEGQVQEGYDQLEQMGIIHEAKDADKRYRELAEDYADIHAKGKSALVVSPTHAEGDQVTEHIRDVLHKQGVLGEQLHGVTQLRNKHLTEAERGDSHHYEQGHVVRFQQNAKGGIKKGEQFTVSAVAKGQVSLTNDAGESSILDLSQAKRFDVYAPQPLAFRQGDAVRVTEGCTGKDGKRINNGSIYAFEKLDEDGNLVLEGGRVLEAKRGNFNYGYVSTSHASQGKTVDHIFIAQSSESFTATSAEQFYVSVSRGKQGVHIHTDDTKALREHIEHSQQRMSATELMKKDQPVDMLKEWSAKLPAIAQYAAFVREQSPDSSPNWLCAFDHLHQAEPNKEMPKEKSL